MKKQSLNNFSRGLNTDLNPLTTPQDVLVESRNVEYITTEGDQVILQKRIGNDPELYEDVQVTLSPGFKPVAVTELNNIAYILSHKEATDEGEIGTFPSPDYEKFKWKPVSLFPLSNDVKISATFDDGIRGIPLFTVTPQLFEQKYVEAGEINLTDTFVIENIGKDEDSYTITMNYSPFLLLIGTNYITLQPGESATVTIEYITDLPGFTKSQTLTVRSSLDNNVSKDVEWRNMTVYQPNANWTTKRYWVSSSDSNFNMGENYRVSMDDYQIHLRVIVAITPGEPPVIVRFRGHYYDGPPPQINAASGLPIISFEDLTPDAPPALSKTTDSKGYDAISVTDSREFRVVLAFHPFICNDIALDGCPSIKLMPQIWQLPESAFQYAYFDGGKDEDTQYLDNVLPRPVIGITVETPRKWYYDLTPPEYNEVPILP